MHFGSSSSRLVHERDQNLLYVQVFAEAETVNSGLFSKSKVAKAAPKLTNIAIYDIAKDTTTYLLPTDAQRQIYTFMFEQSFDTEKEQLIFHNEGNVINNEKLEASRLPKDKLLVIIRKEEKRQLEFWTSNKKGEQLQCVHTMPWNWLWRLDVLNNKFIFIKPLDNGVKIEALDW